MLNVSLLFSLILISRKTWENLAFPPVFFSTESIRQIPDDDTIECVSNIIEYDIFSMNTTETSTDNVRNRARTCMDNQEFFATHFLLPVFYSFNCVNRFVWHTFARSIVLFLYFMCVIWYDTRLVHTHTHTYIHSSSQISKWHDLLLKFL